MRVVLPGFAKFMMCCLGLQSARRATGFCKVHDMLLGFAKCMMCCWVLQSACYPAGFCKVYDSVWCSDLYFTTIVLCQTTYSIKCERMFVCVE